MKTQPKPAIKHASPTRTGTGRVNRFARRCRKNRSAVIPSPSVAHSFIRDTQGHLIRHSLGPWLRDTRYDPAGRISGYTHWYQTNTTASNNGNNGEGYADPTPDQSFAYDNLGRLTQVQTPQATWAYQYDANGNRTQVQLASGPNSRTSSYQTAPDSNRLLGTTNPALSLSHDAAGNLISDGQYTLTIDASGRISQLATPQNTTATYAHNNQGLRVRKHGDANGTGGATLFVYDLHPTAAGGLPSSYPHLIGEYDSSGSPIREYIWLGDTPVAMAMPDVNTPGVPKLFYIHTDHLNTPRIAIERSNGAQRWRWMGEPFGTSAPEERVNGAPRLTLPLRFPGQYADAESGMAYNVMRSYISGVGRYSQSDPIGLAGGINTYGYVGENPVSLADPLGLDNPGMGPYGGPWTGVWRCQRSINISWVGSASAVLPNHNWLLTGPYESGMGAQCPVPGQGCSDKPGAPTQTLNHNGQSSQPGAKCEPVPNVDEQCVSAAIRPGQSTGRWMPWNQCQSFADEVLDRCSTKPRVPFMPGSGQLWR